MDSSKLAAAAEALVQAAVEGTEAKGFALSREIATSVKRLADGTFKESVDDKLNTVHQHLSDLKDAVASLEEVAQLQTTLLKEQIKLQRIQGALNDDSYITSQRFDYADASNTTRYSDVLVKAILRSFRQGRGYYIANLCFMRNYETVKDTAGFQARLCDQLQELIGKRPRVTEVDGKTTIWYE